VVVVIGDRKGRVGVGIDNKIEQFKVEKIHYWISKGAKLSDTVHNFLVSKKVISGKKINALPKKKPIAKVAEAGAEAPKAAAPAAPAEPVTA
jgi:small subunit ribosomal protein S16